MVLKPAPALAVLDLLEDFFGSLGVTKEADDQKPCGGLTEKRLLARASRRDGSGRAHAPKPARRPHTPSIRGSDPSPSGEELRLEHPQHGQAHHEAQ
jgi:hypothetical protein